jgi:transposase
LKLGAFIEQLTTWLETDAALPGKKRKRTAQRLYECLQVEGYVGGYSAVQRYVKAWKASRSASPAIKQAFVPLLFPAGETCQFDWSHERVVIAGVEQVVKVAHFRLSYSRQMFVAAYPRETQEMVLDAHNQAFIFFGGVPKRRVSATAPALLSHKDVANAENAGAFFRLPPASLQQLC